MIYAGSAMRPANVAQVFIFGAGGLGREIFTWMRGLVDGPGQPLLAGFIDDDPLVGSGLRSRGIDLPVQTAREAASGGGSVGFVMAIADPGVKERLYEMAVDLGLTPCGLVHDSVVLGHDVILGEGCVVLPGVVATANVRVGRGVLVNQLTRLGHDVSVGSFSTLLGSNIINGDVRVGNRVLVGSGAVVHQGLDIGDDAVLGMGSVVFRDVPSGASVLGNPARQMR